MRTFKDSIQQVRFYPVSSSTEYVETEVDNQIVENLKVLYGYSTMYQSVQPGYMLMILNSDDRDLVGGYLEVKGISWMEGDTSLISNYTVNINYVDEICTLT